jgi:Cu2+-exporting ATPase
MPVNAVLLVGTNLRTFRSAWLRVLGGIRLPVLYTVLVVATLASGQFLARALMVWLAAPASRPELTAERGGCLGIDRALLFFFFLSVEASSAGACRPARPGDRVVVRADETFPADGRVIGGEGIVDERSVRGLEGASRKRTGDAVLAGSTVLAGTVRVEVTKPGDRTRASSIVRDLVAATSPAIGPMCPTPRAEVFAEQAVGPTLATAGIGLLVGDLTTFIAISGLTSDGSGLAGPLETLRNATPRPAGIVYSPARCLRAAGQGGLDCARRRPV